MSWETVIGLEIHVQLNTLSKMFSPAPNQSGQEPNTQISFIDLALPGVLPVANKAAIEKAIRLGLALNAHINLKNVFARKNYFYPDLPKGYQISQMDLPIIQGGEVPITANGATKIVRVTRAHLEEDAGKLVHQNERGLTGIDLNRAGVPLIEIVSEPDMRSAAEASAYAKTLHKWVTWLGICAGDMEAGNFRMDANVSVRQLGDTALGTRREIKNLNSFRFLEQAIDYEMKWQIDQLKRGNAIEQATVLFNADTGQTRAMRSKENAHDYRYFSDPDLLPVYIEQAQIDAIKKSMPPLPEATKEHFKITYQLSDYDASLLTASRAIALYFETTATLSNSPKLAANWIIGELTAHLNKAGLSVDESPIQAKQLAGLIKRLHDGALCNTLAKQVFEKMWQSGLDPDVIIQRDNLAGKTNADDIEKLVAEVIAKNTLLVEQFLSGKEKAINVLIGQVIKASGGKAEPAKVSMILQEKLRSPHGISILVKATVQKISLSGH